MMTPFFRMQIVYHVPTQRIGEVLCDPFNPFVERQWLPVRAENAKAKPTHEDWRSAECEPLGYNWNEAWKRYHRLLEAKGLEQK